ncbi:MAG: PLP-dependent aspartate aminotransferase family protein [Bacteroidetes bacterium]|nr:PLP-dependent aspartate aminotransferase family protein [Bacteroidota bacterium]
MNQSFKSLNTTCTHVGEVADTQFKGAVSPLYMSTSYAYEDVAVKRYPRYYNTPNQVGVAQKIAALEHTEAGMIFGSGMAAISHALFAFLKQGDHVVFQKELYGGTMNLIFTEFPKYGISYSFAENEEVVSFEKVIRSNTKIIYIETPSNPLLTITDIAAVSKLAKSKGILTMIDNTFASPVNQNPYDFGIDIILHSATKYLGGHSDILAGAVAASQAHIDQIFKSAINFGGSLSDFTVWLLERSIKTMALRVQAQNQNAQQMAEFLLAHKAVDRVFYPGLPSHPTHAIAKKQMHGFGGMLSFELKPDYDTEKFLQSLQLIKPSMSLAGVESTMLSPTKTSHALLSAEERANQGIRDGLIRFSVGIEGVEDLVADIENAIVKSLRKQLV